MTLKQLGDFQLEKRIGQGGMGEVYLARQLSLDRVVAVKLLPRSLASQENFIERFQREAKAAANLIHPNVIQIYSIGIEGGIPYFAMEYVEGEDLQQRMRRLGRLSFEESVEIVAGVSNALACAFEKGIVHRDIKPSNIMIDKNNVVKVMDFGLAKATQDGSVTNLTAAGLIMGTPNYISPEQARGDEEIDSRSDIYSLGIVFYELVTGALPFRADTPAALIYKHAFEEPDPPTSVAGDVPPFLEEIVLRMICKEPRDRYPNPKALLVDLNEFKRNAEYYLKGGGRKIPVVGGDPVHQNQTLIDGKAAPPGAKKGMSTSTFKRADTMPDNTHDDATFVEAEATPSTGGMQKALIAALLLLAVGAGGYFAIGPEKLRALLAAGPAGGGAQSPAAQGQSPTPNQQLTPLEPTPTGMLVFPGVALGNLMPENVSAYVIRNFQEHVFARVDQKVQPGELINMVFKKRGHTPIHVTFTVSAAGIAPSLKEVETRLREFEVLEELVDQYERGRQLIRDKRYEEAFRLLEVVVTKVPDFKDAQVALADARENMQAVDAMYETGRLQHAQRRWRDALNTLKQIPTGTQKATLAEALMATCQTQLRALNGLRSQFEQGLAQGRYEEVLSLVKELEDLVPLDSKEPAELREKVRDAEAIYLRGKRQFELGHYAEAISAFDQLLDISPKHDAFAQGGMYSRAKAEVAAAEARERGEKGGLAEAYRLLGEARYLEAITAAEGVLEVSATNEQAKQIIADARAGIAKVEIAEAFAQLDKHFKDKDVTEVLRRVDPTAPLAKQLEPELRALFAAPITIERAAHDDLAIKLAPGPGGERTVAEVECWWHVTLSFPGLESAEPKVKTRQIVQVRQRVRMRRAEGWLFVSFVQEGEASVQ